MIIKLSNLSLGNIILLNNIYSENQSNFNKLIEKIYNKTDKSIDWLVSNIIYVCNPWDK